jgi:hypothetical protein
MVPTGCAAEIGTLLQQATGGGQRRHGQCHSLRIRYNLSHFRGRAVFDFKS